MAIDTAFKGMLGKHLGKIWV